MGHSRFVSYRELPYGEAPPTRRAGSGSYGLSRQTKKGVEMSGTGIPAIDPFNFILALAA
jgi:hypothetical protein